MYYVGSIKGCFEVYRLTYLDDEGTWCAYMGFKAQAPQ